MKRAATKRMKPVRRTWERWMLVTCGGNLELRKHKGKTPDGCTKCEVIAVEIREVAKGREKGGAK